MISTLSIRQVAERSEGLTGSPRRLADPGFEPEASQLFLPKWSKIPKTVRAGYPPLPGAGRELAWAPAVGVLLGSKAQPQPDSKRRCREVVCN